MPITESDVSELYTKDEAADFLHISVKTLERMIRRRDIDYLRVGSGTGRIRISKRALLDYLNRSQISAAKAKRGRAS